MSINDIVICDPARLRDSDPWPGICRQLERAGFGLYFDAVSDNAVLANNWVEVKPGAPPTSGAFLTDSPSSKQARVLLSYYIHEPDQYETWPWEGSWPADVRDTVRAMTGAFDLQPLFVADESFDFYNALVEAIGLSTDGLLFGDSIGGALRSFDGRAWQPLE